MHTYVFFIFYFLEHQIGVKVSFLHHQGVQYLPIHTLLAFLQVIIVRWGTPIQTLLTSLSHPLAS